MTDRAHRIGEVGGFLVAWPDGLRALDEVPEAELSPGVQSLVDQEVHGNRRGATAARVSSLLASFGFEWETTAEPGHMRFVDRAAEMLERAGRHADRAARQLATDLDLPFHLVSGVNVVDCRSPELAEYLELIHHEPELYGADPYRLAEPRPDLMLRPTSCLQKFTIARAWDHAPASAARCLFEISDSFRGEPIENLELGFRLRRFRLPEAHLHSSSIEGSLAQAAVVHHRTVDRLEGDGHEFTMLISVSSRFLEQHGDFVADVVAVADRPALVHVAPAGSICADGIEVDVEYKVLDAHGFARELMTFQVDELITRAVGLSTDAAPLTTIHVVPVGGLERSIFAALDRAAQVEATGRRAVLPRWLAPTDVRILDGSDASGALAAELAAASLAVELDDRPIPRSEQEGEAWADLVPHVVRVAGDPQRAQLEVRGPDDEDFRTCTAAQLVGQLPATAHPDGPRAGVRRLAQGMNRVVAPCWWER